MKINWVWVLIVASLGGLPVFGAKDLHSSKTNLTDVGEIWAGMLAQGMISEGQYQHVLETGHLPGSTTVSNSPVAVEAQADWNKLTNRIDHYLRRARIDAV